jgi:hypothetical protein
MVPAVLPTTVPYSSYLLSAGPPKKQTNISEQKIDFEIVIFDEK